MRPKSRKYPQWAVIICPSSEAKLAQNGERDDTVVIGGDATDRGFVSKILEAMVEACPSDSKPLVPLTLPVYEHFFRDAAAALGLSALKISPHAEARRRERRRIVGRPLAFGDTASRPLEIRLECG